MKTIKLAKTLGVIVLASGLVSIGVHALVTRYRHQETEEARIALVGEWYGHGETWKFSSDGTALITVLGRGPNGVDVMSATYDFNEFPVRSEKGWFRFKMIIEKTVIVNGFVIPPETGKGGLIMVANNKVDFTPAHPNRRKKDDS